MNKRELIQKTLPKSLFIKATLISFVFVSSKVIAAMLFQQLLNEGISWTLIITGFLLVFLAIMCFKYFYVYRRQSKLNLEKDSQQTVLNHLFDSVLYRVEQVNRGKWITLLFSDAEILSNSYSMTSCFLLMGIFQFIIACAYGFFYSWILTLVILLISCFSVIIPRWIEKTVTKRQHQKQQFSQMLRDFFSDSLKQRVLFKTKSEQDFIFNYHQKLYHDVYKSEMGVKKAQQLMTSVTIGIGYFMNGIWLLFGLWLVNHQSINLGIFVGFMSLSNEFSWPFNQLPELWSNLSVQIAAYQRIYQPVKKELVSIQNDDDLVSVVHQSVQYGDKTILDDISFSVKPHEKWAITGPSGCGKSTLMKLMMGLLPGKVHHRSHLRIGYAGQEFGLLTGSIREAITMGDSFSDEEIQNILPLVNLSIDLETDVCTLSHGQAQRVAIARALIRPADIYFFDEISSALDKQSEQIVLRTIKNLPAAVVMISHRSDSIQMMDHCLNMR